MMCVLCFLFLLFAATFFKLLIYISYILPTTVSSIYPANDIVFNLLQNHLINVKIKCIYKMDLHHGILNSIVSNCSQERQKRKENVTVLILKAYGLVNINDYAIQLH